MAKAPKKPVAAPRQSKAVTAALAAQEKKFAALSSLFGSGLVGRGRMSQRLAGIQYSGLRDINTVAGYVQQGHERFAHYWGLYSRGDIAGRVVDMPANTTWRTPPEIYEEDHPDGTAFTEAFDDLAKRLKLWQHFTRLDRLAGIGRYGVMLLGVKGVQDFQMTEPLERISKPSDLIYIAVYHEDNARITDWEADPGNPRFGLPKVYNLRTAVDTKSYQNSSLAVHSSRVIHAAENCLEDDVFGRPRLQRLLNRLFDLEKVAASTGEAYWQLCSRILQANIDKDVEVDEPALKELSEHLEEMTHDLRRQFHGQGVKLEWLGSQTPNVSQVGEFFFGLIAAGAGIPKRILFGSELGQLASTTDQATYMGTINERQEQFAEPQILRQFVDRMIEFRVLPKPTTGDYGVIWPTLFEDSEKDRAMANHFRAQIAQALTPVGGNPRELVEIDSESNVWLMERDADPPFEQPPPGTGLPGIADGGEQVEGSGASPAGSDAGGVGPGVPGTPGGPAAPGVSESGGNPLPAPGGAGTS